MNNILILKKINDKDFSNNHKLYKETIDDIIFEETKNYEKLLKYRKYTANSAETILKEIQKKWKLVILRCLYFNDNCFKYLTNSYLKLINNVISKIKYYLNHNEFTKFNELYLENIDIEKELNDIINEKLNYLNFKD